MLDVAVIIVSWNVRDYLADCLRSLYADLARSGLQAEVWVVDNASTDGTIELLEDLFPQVHLVLSEENLGFGRANNLGMMTASAHNPRTYFLLNPDTLVQSGAVKSLVKCLDERPKAGMVGARLVYGDGRFQHSAFSFPGLGQIAFDLFSLPPRLYESRLNGRYPRTRYGYNSPPFLIDHPLGATMLVRADVAQVTGGFDESFHMYCEEIDWSWRIREAGWEIYAVPQATIIHYGGESTRQIPLTSFQNLWQSRAQLYRKHHGRLINWLARRLVQWGMKQRAAQNPDPEYQQAYHQIMTAWQW